MWRDTNNDRSNVLFDGSVDIVATFRKNDNKESRGFLSAFHDLSSGVVQLISYVPLATLVEHVVGGRNLDAFISMSWRVSILKKKILTNIATRLNKALDHVQNCVLGESALLLVDDDCPVKNFRRFKETLVNPKSITIGI